MTTDQHEQYEGLFVLDADLSDDALTKFQTQITGQITKLGGVVERSQAWGKRRLAYRIRRKRDGFYLLLLIRLAPSAVAPLEQWARLQETILRQLVVRSMGEVLQPVEASHGQSE